MLSSIEDDDARYALSLLNSGSFNELIDFADQLSSKEVLTAAKHRVNGQIAAVIRKFPFPTGTVSFDPKGEATKTFFACEHKCKRVNQRFSAYRKVRSPHEMLLEKARSWIAYVLGEFNLSDVQSDAAFGAGASLGIHGNATNSARKLLSKSWTVSAGAHDYARAALKKDLLIWEYINKAPNQSFFSFDLDLFNSGFSSRAKIIDYNNITFVPKTAKVHRTIAVEPLLNGYLQKGVDSFMRKRLKRVGIDLRDQGINQRLSREGSLNWRDPNALCTIDLSSASDSISIELCRYLLPADWFYYLDSIRSHRFRLDGKIYTYQKFTSMGNGFCFPLETLIFASLCSAVCSSQGREQLFSVYGDDIIVQKAVFEPLVHLLHTCGFKVNPKKTFSEGPFRESCGSDWFEGEDVRPIILDYNLDSLQAIFKFCNMVRSKDHIKLIFYESLEFLEKLIPPTLMFTRPYSGNADTCLEVPWDVFMASPYSKWNRNLFCWSWVELLTSATPDDRVKRFAGFNIALMRGALTGINSSIPFAERYSSRTKLCRRSYCGTMSTFLPKGIYSPMVG
jgi:hypothetical protein